MISLYGGSGFVGGTFQKMYDGLINVERDERKPKSNKILYFISTVDNYNLHENITLDVDTNLHLLCEVLDHCRSEDIEFNYISSWFVYGKTSSVPVKEDTICNPTGFYSITKKCAEDLLISAIKATSEELNIDKKSATELFSIDFLIALIGDRILFSSINFFLLLNILSSTSPYFIN